MQRRAYVPGTVLTSVLASVLLAAGLAGCTGGSAAGESAADTRPGASSTTAPAAEPGKHRTLPDPCEAVGRDTLRALLPGVEELSEELAEKAYEGEAVVTYDSDRRVGCGWKDEAPEGSRHLTVDFERVVSYDPAVSDEDRAQTLYEKKAETARVPSSGPSAEGDPTAGETGAEDEGGDAPDGGTGASPPPPSAGDEKSGKDGKDAGKGEKDGKKDDEKKAEDDEKPEDDGSGSGEGVATGEPDPGSETVSRPVEDLGDIAYLDDRLVTTGTGSGIHRDVTVVFRSSNALVTVRYDQWSTDSSAFPGSADMQEGTVGLAGELAEGLDG